jgi:hypothetical protein
MKTKENVTVYSCDFCVKKLFRKHAMIKHEKFCESNPINKNACSDCRFLKEDRVEVGTNGDQEVYRKGFLCAKKNINIYPIKVEKLGLPERYPDTFEDQEPMPKDCDFHENYFQGSGVFDS